MRRALALMGVASIILLAASGATALEVARQPATIQPEGFGTAAAQCPNGRTAVAGGFAAPAFDTGTGPAIGRLGFKHPGKRRIETRGFNFGGATGDLVSYAYCALHDHGFTIRSARTRIEPQAMGTAVAECPSGTEAVGGGFDASRVSAAKVPAVLTLTSKREGERGWKAVAVNIPPGSGLGAPGTLTAYAYCESSPYELHAESKDVAPPANDAKTYDLRCPHGGRAFSGGFDGHVEVAPQPIATAAVTSRRVSRGHAWRTTALSVFNSGIASATLYAYCRG